MLMVTLHKCHQLLVELMCAYIKFDYRKQTWRNYFILGISESIDYIHRPHSRQVSVPDLTMLTNSSHAEARIFWENSREKRDNSNIHLRFLKRNSSCRWLSHKQLKMHGCILTTVAIDALVLKHHVIRIHHAVQISIKLDQFQTKIIHFWKILENKTQLI